MYTPPSFRIEDREALLAIMREHSFATLVTQNAGAMVASHLPLLLDLGESSSRLVGHMARANDQWQAFDGQSEALAIFHGPHGYISPAWYAQHPSVPTWNYTVVHAYGSPKVIEDYQAAVEILRRTVDFYEGGRAEPWRMETLPADYVEKMVRAIVAFEIPLTRIEGKAKLSQNRSVEDRNRAIAALAQSEQFEDRQLANSMREALVRAEDTVQ